MAAVVVVVNVYVAMKVHACCHVYWLMLTKYNRYHYQKVATNLLLQSFMLRSPQWF